jgi:hypothetical protein
MNKLTKSWGASLGYLLLKPVCSMPVWHQRIVPSCNCKFSCNYIFAHNNKIPIIKQHCAKPVDSADQLFIQKKELSIGEFRGIHHYRFTDYINNILKKF